MKKIIRTKKGQKITVDGPNADGIELEFTNDTVIKDKKEKKDK